MEKIDIINNIEIDASIDTTTIPDDYTIILKKYTANFIDINPYVLVGKPQSKQGWIMHISVVISQIMEMLETVLPILSDRNTSYKIIKDKTSHISLNNALWGIEKIGKIITIYPQGDKEALEIYLALKDRIKHLKGPSIITDFYLGSNIYVRYGSFVESGDRSFVDGAGSVIEDRYYIPAIQPKGIPNPFSAYIQENVTPKNEKFLNKKYYPVKLLANTIKGNVIQAIFLKDFRIRKCVIKQGRRNMSSDEGGRDMIDRLKWQIEVHNQMHGKINIPRIYDYFEKIEGGYLAMEYISNQSLCFEIKKIFNNSTWFQLSKDKKIKILDHVLMVIQAIKSLHKEGIVHRDITDSNFLLKNNKIYLIDLELAYSKKDNKPFPAFTWGTNGYASPQQMQLQTPDYSDDIYSLGGLMMFCFTSIEPIFIVENDPQKTAEKISFLTRDREISKLIMGCTTFEPEKRISLEKIENEINKLHKTISKSISSDTDNNEINSWSKEDVRIIVQKIIDSFGSSLFSKNDIWISFYKVDQSADVNFDANRQPLPGIYAGVPGVLYLLSKLKIKGFDISKTNGVLYKSLDFINEVYLNSIDRLDTGLYLGTAGIGLSLFYSINSGIIEQNDYWVSKIKECLSRESSDLDMTYGEAGIGMAILACKSILPDKLVEDLLHHKVSRIISSQNKDGSWSILNRETNNQEKINGFSFGIAGIIYFLVKSLEIHDNLETRKSILSGLSYLEKVSIKGKDNIRWQNSNYDKSILPGLGPGYHGVAITFQVAFEKLKIKQFKTIAERILNSDPTYIVNSNKTYLYGIAGIGDIYMNMAQSLELHLADKKTKWIADYLLTLKIDYDEKTFWLIENPYFPTPDLLIGNGGLLHFLMNYCTNDDTDIALIN